MTDPDRGVTPMTSPDHPPARRRPTLRRAAALALVPMLAASLVQAQLVDIDTTTCNPGPHLGSFDTETALTESIGAITNPLGANVFWEMTFSAGPSTVTCTPTPPAGFATSYDCDNGLVVALPAGADEVVSVVSTAPIDVTAAAGSAAGTATFSITATRDDDALAGCQVVSPDPALGCGSFPSCSAIYEVELLPASEPFDLVFVLDQSGSMSLGSDGDTRWDALVTGVEAFLPFVSMEAAGTPGQDSTVGIVRFASGHENPGEPLFDILSGGADSADFADIANDLGGLAPSGLTAMGTGVEAGLALASDPSRNRAIALFSDGEQNVSPDVSPDGCFLVGPDGPDAGSEPDVLAEINGPGCPATDGVRICTVGIGSPSGTYLSTLEALGYNNQGATILTDNGTDFEGNGEVYADIGAAFQECIGVLLQDNSPQQVAYTTGTLGASPVELPAFSVNARIDAVLLSMVLERKFETPNLAQIASLITIERDGVDVTEEFELQIYGRFTNVMTLVSEYSAEDGANPQGDYVVRIAEDPSIGEGLAYRLSTYVDDRRLEIGSTLSQSVVPVNETLDIAVDLSWLGRGIEGADVVVRVFAPAGDMGDVLSDAQVVDVSGGEDAANAGVQKYDANAADPNFLAALALSPNAIPVTDAGGGRYEASYTVPDNVGVYHIIYDVAGSATGSGPIQRRWVESVYGAVDGIDAGASQLTSVVTDAGLVLTGTFQRPGGKKVGPGNGEGFIFDGAEVINIQDHQDGRYSFTLATSDPDSALSVSFGSNPAPFYDGPAAWGTFERGAFAPLFDWPWWLLILIALLLLLLVLWRRVLRT